MIIPGELLEEVGCLEIWRHCPCNFNEGNRFFYERRVEKTVIYVETQLLVLMQIFFFKVCIIPYLLTCYYHFTRFRGRLKLVAHHTRSVSTTYWHCIVVDASFCTRILIAAVQIVNLTTLCTHTHSQSHTQFILCYLHLHKHNLLKN